MEYFHPEMTGFLMCDRQEQNQMIRVSLIRIAALFSALVLMLGIQPPKAYAAVNWPAGDRVNILDRQDLPWSLVQLSDGSLLFTSAKGGTITHVTGVNQARIVGRVPDLRTEGDGGLLGLAQDRDDASVFYAYASSATPAGARNRVWRLRWDGTAMTTDRVIVSDIPHGSKNNGGALAVGPDGYLYIGTGDADDRSTPQDLASLGGKVLRVDRNGQAPADNPFVGRTGADPRIWSIGHASVQGFTWSMGGSMLATESAGINFGEMNLITPGSNYAWPICDGMEPLDGTTWCEGFDGRFERTTNEWQGAMGGIASKGYTAFLAASDEQVLQLWPVGNGSPQRELRNNFGRLRAVVLAADGRLILTTANGGDSDRIIIVDPDPWQPVGKRYLELGGAAALGAKEGGPWCGLKEYGCFSLYEHGSIYISNRTDARAVIGAIRYRWGQLRWENGPLGYPVSEEMCGLREGGCWQQFQGGAIYWSEKTGAWPVWGGINMTWHQLRWEQGVLGYPASPEFCTIRDDGCFQRFEKGSIYWSPGTGAWAVRGALRDQWARDGWENGRWGYPISNEACEPGHCWQTFQGGVIHIRW